MKVLIIFLIVLSFVSCGKGNHIKANQLDGGRNLFQLDDDGKIKIEGVVSTIMNNLFISSAHAKGASQEEINKTLDQIKAEQAKLDELQAMVDAGKTKDAKGDQAQIDKMQANLDENIKKMGQIMGVDFFALLEPKSDIENNLIKFAKDLDQLQMEQAKVDEMQALLDMGKFKGSQADIDKMQANLDANISAMGQKMGVDFVALLEAKAEADIEMNLIKFANDLDQIKAEQAKIDEMQALLDMGKFKGSQADIDKMQANLDANISAMGQKMGVDFFALLEAREAEEKAKEEAAEKLAEEKAAAEEAAKESNMIKYAEYLDWLQLEQSKIDEMQALLDMGQFKGSQADIDNIQAKLDAETVATGQKLGVDMFPLLEYAKELAAEEAAEKLAAEKLAAEEAAKKLAAEKLAIADKLAIAEKLAAEEAKKEAVDEDCLRKIDLLGDFFVMPVQANQEVAKQNLEMMQAAVKVDMVEVCASLSLTLEDLQYILLSTNQLESNLTGTDLADISAGIIQNLEDLLSLLSEEDYKSLDIDLGADADLSSGLATVFVNDENKVLKIIRIISIAADGKYVLELDKEIAQHGYIHFSGLLNNSGEILSRKAAIFPELENMEANVNPDTESVVMDLMSTIYDDGELDIKKLAQEEVRVKSELEQKKTEFEDIRSTVDKSFSMIKVLKEQPEIVKSILRTYIVKRLDQEDLMSYAKEFIYIMKDYENAEDLANNILEQYNDFPKIIQGLAFEAEAKGLVKLVRETKFDDVQISDGVVMDGGAVMGGGMSLGGIGFR